MKHLIPLKLRWENLAKIWRKTFKHTHTHPSDGDNVLLALGKAAAQDLETWKSGEGCFVFVFLGQKKKKVCGGH